MNYTIEEPTFISKASSTCCVFLRNSTETGQFYRQLILRSPRQDRRRQRKQPVCCGGAAFFFHNKTWTIIPTLGSLRVYVHPWSEFPFDSSSLVAVTRIRASVSTPPKLNNYRILSREQTHPLHTPRSTPFLHIHTRPE